MQQSVQIVKTLPKQKKLSYTSASMVRIKDKKQFDFLLKVILQKDNSMFLVVKPLFLYEAYHDNLKHIDVSHRDKKL